MKTQTGGGGKGGGRTAVGRLRDMSWYAHLRSSSPCLIRPRLFSFSPAPRSSLTNAAKASRIPWFTSIPSFRQQLARTNKVPSFGERVRCPSVRNQVLVSTRNASSPRDKLADMNSLLVLPPSWCFPWRPAPRTTRPLSGPSSSASLRRHGGLGRPQTMR